jgi:hypothetical protein
LANQKWKTANQANPAGKGFHVSHRIFSQNNKKRNPRSEPYGMEFSVHRREQKFNPRIYNLILYFRHYMEWNFPFTEVKKK